ncbi:3-oxoacyl-[acyl-carrier protein] reductase [Sphingobium indicum BiD32]|uniref:3-oxoacyl-[acyl-carrier protein] reductase n=1 Tax=Sphingobium indicum BiD32 TaxID=1301087 RepID=N1MNM7_9SPHN|nr:SDR family oxidoreductase [Sphingobium indicum]CCW18334.1 3-oxoacyl-[acyl-carrier protein] reductase [Sphingobium indicum BiD32]
MRFLGKVILVTGGTSGIGLATACRLASEGARLIVTGHSSDHLATARRALPDALVIDNDVADPAAADELAEVIRKQVGILDAAFLNAGFGAFATLAEIGADDIDRHVAIDLRAPLLQAKALEPLLRDGGAVLLIGSATVGSPRADALVYSAVKAGIRQAARSLATEFAPRGIRVNVIAPGATETNFHSRGGMSAEEQKLYKEKTAAAVPLKRLGRAEDVAAVACFLLSDDAGYVTGAELRVDGGLSMA